MPKFIIVYAPSVLKAVMVVPREEELFASTPKMLSWMIANAHIRRKLSYRDAMSSLVPIGNQGTGQRWGGQCWSLGQLKWSPRVWWGCRLLNLSSFSPGEAMIFHFHHAWNPSVQNAECPEWCFSFLARWNRRQSIPFMSVSLSLDAVSILTITIAQHCHSPVRFSARWSLAPPPSIRGCKELRARWCHLLTGQVKNELERSSHNHSSCLQALPFPMWVYFGCQACKENPSRSWNGEAGLCVSTGVCFVGKWSSAFPGGNGLNPWCLKHSRRWWCHILLR